MFCSETQSLIRPHVGWLRWHCLPRLDTQTLLIQFPRFFVQSNTHRGNCRPAGTRLASPPARRLRPRADGDASLRADYAVFDERLWLPGSRDSSGQYHVTWQRLWRSFLGIFRASLLSVLMLPRRSLLQLPGRPMMTQHEPYEWRALTNSNNVHLNPYSAELILCKSWRPKCFFSNLKSS